jgi:hypothetical protein
LTAREIMLTSIKKMKVKSIESGKAIDIDRLYHIAAQLTIATCSKEFPAGYNTSGEDQQELFAKHFSFLIDHAIDLIDLELQGQ